MNYCAYIAYNLKDDDFEDLSNSLAERLSGNEIISYAPGKDAGKDGRRLGFSKNINKWKSSGSKFITQAKHTKEYNASCSEHKFFKNNTSIISEEIKKINQLISSDELEYYALFTNRKYTGNIDLIIRKKISDETGLDIDNIEILGIETINRLLNLEANHDLVAQYNLHPNPGELNLCISVLTKNDKPILLDNIILKDQYYIPRHFVQSNDQNNNYHYGQTIEEIVSEKQFICILGNPGTGKTTTLKKMALGLWKNGEQTDYTPIYKSLKNFTINNTIENFLPEKHKTLHKIIFIFDGIDEISDIENFKSELNNFISRHREKDSLKDLKFIISCRSNIYNKVVNQISDYSIYHLQDLFYQESFDLLEKLCPNLKIDSFNFNNRLKEFIKTPLQTEILASYINEHNRLVDNIGLLWEEYINQRFKIDSNDKLSKIGINKPLIIKESKKIGFINELMQTSVINEDTLFEIIEHNQFKDFKKHPLLDYDIKHDTYSFQNQNIQEYFAAKAISKLSFEGILKIIRIEDLNQTYPSLLNTLSFVIDLTDNEKSKKIIDWLFLHESSVLINSDSNRISPKHKEAVFQRYFKQTCIEKHFWIGNSSETEKIAQFGNCEANYIYLVNIIKDEKLHFRVTQSAISLLSNFSIHGKEPEVITLFLDKLDNKEIITGIKAEILQCIRDLKLTFFDKQLLDTIVSIFINNDEKSICKYVLDLISNEEDVDKYYEYIHLEFLRIYGILERKSTDETHYGTEYVLDNIVRKIQNGNNFIDLIIFYFLDSNSYKSEITETLINKAGSIIFNDKILIIKFFKAIEKDNLYHSKNEEIFNKIIKKSKSKNVLLKYLIKNIDVNELYNFSHFVTSETLEEILEKLISKNISNEKLEQFRNLLGNCNSRELAKEFENLLESRKITIKEKFSTKKEEELILKKAKEFTQSNFDILFEIETLKTEIEKVFNKFNNTITTDDYKLLHRNWWKNNEHFSSNCRSAIYQVIHHILYSENNRKPISLDNSLKIIEKYDLIRIRIIVNKISNNTKPTNIEITEYHKREVQNWCDKTISTINFNEVLVISENTYSYHLSNNFQKIKFIHFFKEYINVNIPVKFLIKTIPYFKLESFNENDKLSMIKKWINDDIAFNQQIIYDLKNKKLTVISESRHIKYAIENKLIEVTNEIRMYFEQKEYTPINEFKEYITNFNLVNTLKEYCFNINSMLFWASIELMIEQGKDSSFCIDNALIYLDSNEINYRQNALNVLFLKKHEKAINYFIFFLKNKKINDRELMVSANSYDCIQDDDTIIELYKLIYLGTNIDGYNRHTYQEFMNTFVSNISKINYTLIKSQLEKTKQILAKTEDDLFYINKLLDTSKESYIASLSKPMSLDKALEFVKNVHI